MLLSFVQLLFRFLFRIEVRGTMQPAEKLLIVSNHQSFLDGILLGAVLPVQPDRALRSKDTHSTKVDNRS